MYFYRLLILITIDFCSAQDSSILIWGNVNNEPCIGLSYKTNRNDCTLGAFDLNFRQFDKISSNHLDSLLLLAGAVRITDSTDTQSLYIGLFKKFKNQIKNDIAWISVNALLNYVNEIIPELKDINNFHISNFDPVLMKLLGLPNVQYNLKKLGASLLLPQLIVLPKHMILNESTNNDTGVEL